MLSSKLRIAGVMLLDDTKHDIQITADTLKINASDAINLEGPVVIVTVNESMPEVMPALLYFMSQFPEIAWQSKWTSEVGVTQFIGRADD